MPAIAKTSTEAILTAARHILNQHGPDGLSMEAVATAVGIKAPSLYKHFADRPALLQATMRIVAAEMRAGLEQAAQTGNVKGDLKAMADALRAFARQAPQLYALFFQPPGKNSPLSTAEHQQLVQPLLAKLEKLTGPRHALPAARTLVAYTHGFLSMEIAGAFQLGGDLDAAFAFGLKTILQTLRKPGKKRPAPVSR